MKKTISVILLLFLLISITYADNSAAANVVPKVYLNEKELITSNTPFFNNGDLYLPLKEIKDTFNIRFSWSSSSNGIILHDFQYKNIIYLKPNNSAYKYKAYTKAAFEKDNTFVNLLIDKQETLRFNKPCIDSKGVAYISLSFLEKVLGFRITKDLEQNTILINRSVSAETFESNMKALFDVTYMANSMPLFNYDTTYKYFLNNIIDQNSLRNSWEFEEVDKLNNMLSFVNKTLWIQKKCLYDINEDKLKDYFVKVRIEDVNYTDQFNNTFTIIINEVKYQTKTEFITYASAEDYEIFYKDPKTIYKWTQKTWEYLNKYDYWTGMTKDMAIMTMGRPDDINRTVGSWGTHEQWVYEYSNFDNTYLYFENGKLTSWQD